MSFEKLTPIKDESLPMDAIIAAGFGVAQVTKNGEVVYDENNLPEDGYLDAMWSCQEAENEARKDPDNDWRIILVGPLSATFWQRQGENHWVLYEENQGFA